MEYSFPSQFVCVLLWMFYHKITIVLRGNQFI